MVKQDSRVDELWQHSTGVEPWHRSCDGLDPLQDSSGRLARNMLAQHVTRGLSRDQRLVLLLYYYQELTMSEIGEVLGLSESRIGQIHKEVLWQLQQAWFGSTTGEELAA